MLEARSAGRIMGVLLFVMALLASAHMPVQLVRADPQQPGDTPKITLPPTEEPPPTMIPGPTFVPTSEPTQPRATEEPPTPPPPPPPTATALPQPTAGPGTRRPATAVPPTPLPLPTEPAPGERATPIPLATTPAPLGPVVGPPTRRPTRTPRTTATLTPTPLVAGALRVTVSAEPGRPVAGEDVTFTVELANRGRGSVLDVTLDVSAPGEVVLSEVEALVGQTTELDSLVRWHIPRLPSGGETPLLLTGRVRPVVGSHLELCVMVLSEGAPLEHCAAFETVQGAATPAADDPAEGPAYPTAAVVELFGMETGTGLRPGWLLFFLGLCGLGLWVGLQVRGTRTGEGASGGEATD